MGRKVVFQVQDPEQPGLFQYRQAEHRSRMVLENIVIAGERSLPGSIMQQNGLSGSEHVTENRLR